MKINDINFSNFIVDKHLRIDSKFHNFYNERGWNIFNVPNDEKIRLGEILYEEYKKKEMEEGQTYKGVPTGQKYINKYGFIENYDLVGTVDCPNRIKYEITSNNILISSLRLAKASATYFENIDLEEYIFSNGFYIFNVKDDWNKKYITKVLQLEKIKSILDKNIYRGIGISSYKVEDLLRIEIRDISIEDQLKTLKKIYPLEEEISKLILEIDDTQEIIDLVFKNYFDYDYDTFDRLKTEQTQFKKFDAFANNIDIRFSAKYHRKAGIFATDELCKNSVKIKKALSNISITGKGISPKDFEEDTECYYITMADISTWEIDYQNLKTVSAEYEDKNLLKKPKGEKQAYSTKVKKGDILMMRSGEGGIGKVALVTQDINAIFSDFIIRFRFDENRYIPKFCYYYMRSRYFQYLVEIHKKGLGNNTNIFPNITNEFPIPNIAKSEQKKIIAEIQKHIMQQKEIDRKIKSIQKEISDIIENSIL